MMALKWYTQFAMFYKDVAIIWKWYTSKNCDLYDLSNCTLLTTLNDLQKSLPLVHTFLNYVMELVDKEHCYCVGKTVRLMHQQVSKHQLQQKMLLMQVYLCLNLLNNIVMYAHCTSKLLHM